MPADFEALFMLAVVFYQLGRVEESLTMLERLLDCVPDLALLHEWKAQCLSWLKRGFEAHTAFLKARELQPDSASLLIQHGNHLVTWCHAEQAIELFERAIALEPNNPTAYYDLGRAHRFLGQADKAVLFFRKALELAPDNRAFGNGYLFDLCYQDQLSAEQVADEHRRLGRKQYPDSGVNRGVHVAAPVGRRLRIGYLSADFFMHPVIRFLEPVLHCHDRSRFEIFCYANVTKPDAITRKVQQMDLIWRDITGYSAQIVADLVKADGIDILVDLSGHTAGNRLDVCALKPAPVQVSWLGYPHSTGLTQIDWYLSDNWCDPPGMTDHLYAEQLWRLPELFCCYQPYEPSPPAERTVGSAFTFGCFNNFSKISDDFLRVWAAILMQVPGSRLYLKSVAIGDEKSQQRIKGVFAECGISPDRVQCQSFLASFEEHLACYQQVDIALDTFPYHGTTTTCEALWMGVPVVTLAGRTHLSRVGVALLHAVGLDDLVVDSPDMYIATAARLAANTIRLANLRRSLRGTMERSTLMAHTAFTRQLEEAFASMCELARNNG
ncbi:MAG: tetratricopeptide repeat protein [Geobacter sp.]